MIANGEPGVWEGFIGASPREYNHVRGSILANPHILYGNADIDKVVVSGEHIYFKGANLTQINANSSWGSFTLNAGNNLIHLSFDSNGVPTSVNQNLERFGFWHRGTPGFFNDMHLERDPNDPTYTQQNQYWSVDFGFVAEGDDFYVLERYKIH